MSKELKIGIVAILIIVIFIWGFNFLKGQNLLASGTRTFKVEYAKIGGLSKSSPVTINGLKVGKVDDIEFDIKADTRGHLIVTFIVESDFEFSRNSIVKIYSPNPLSGSSLAIVPNYIGDVALSGDLLKGEMEENLFTSIGERLNPLQQKIERVIVKADTLFSNVNKVLSTTTVSGINSAIANLSLTIIDIQKTIQGVNTLVADNQLSLKQTIDNTKNITNNFSKVSDSIGAIDFSKMIFSAEEAIINFNEISKKINAGDGTIGKLIEDERLYDNLEAATSELEQLLRDIKLHPKRYIHFSIFGKSPEPYSEKLIN
jgi:phospholipid/cholesterol/gamma-HCH transport system substrate-binding protein